MKKENDRRRFPTGHVFKSIRAPVPADDGGEDVIKGREIFGRN